MRIPAQSYRSLVLAVFARLASACADDSCPEGMLRVGAVCIVTNHAALHTDAGDASTHQPDAGPRPSTSEQEP